MNGVKLPPLQPHHTSSLATGRTAPSTSGAVRPLKVLPSVSPNAHCLLRLHSTPDQLSTASVQDQSSTASVDRRASSKRRRRMRMQHLLVGVLSPTGDSGGHRADPLAVARAPQGGRPKSHSDPVRIQNDLDKIHSFLRLISADKIPSLPGTPPDKETESIFARKKKKKTKKKNEALTVPPPVPDSHKSLSSVAHYVSSSNRKTRRRGSVIIANNEEDLYQVHNRRTRSLPHITIAAAQPNTVDVASSTEEESEEAAGAKTITSLVNAVKNKTRRGSVQPETPDTVLDDDQAQALMFATKIRGRRVSFHPENEESLVVQTIYYDKRMKINSGADPGTDRRLSCTTAGLDDTMQLESLTNSPQREAVDVPSASQSKLKKSVLSVPEKTDSGVDNVEHLDYTTFKAWQRGRRHSHEVIQIDAEDQRRLSTSATGGPSPNGEGVVSKLRRAFDVSNLLSRLGLRRVLCCNTGAALHTRPPTGLQMHPQGSSTDGAAIALPSIVVDAISRPETGPVRGHLASSGVKDV